MGLVSLTIAALAADAPKPDPMFEEITRGALRIKTGDGIVECPLKHTDVRADIAGFIARVKVTQTFYNPLDEKIEAVYVFPLPHQAAVDDMTMVIGERRIVGIIKRRAEAREIYAEAIARGQTAGLLEQERPNIFTQSVGNIEPNQEIRIEISYVDVLEYDMGEYMFHFPMVVGPRYIPGNPVSAKAPVPGELKGKIGVPRQPPAKGDRPPSGTGTAADTDRVPDASRITPPVLKPGQRTGHDISLAVRLNAGVPIRGIESPNHDAEIETLNDTEAVAALTPADALPNKDFVLKYRVIGEKPERALLRHDGDDGEGTFMLMVQPKEDERTKKTPPREICFLIDVSGSMSGEPTALVRRTMEDFITLCKDRDTLQVITFAGSAKKLFDAAVPVTGENTKKALNFTRNLRGGGGTEMLKGVKAAINDPLDEERVRIVVMLTDGYIGNEAEIIKEIGRRCGDRIRFWCIGIGSSPNRFLVDGVAKQGGGMAKVLGIKDDPQPFVQQAMYRIHRAQLSGVSIDWGRLGVWETYPARIPELWAGRPIVLFGRYEKADAETTITIHGDAEGDPVTWSLDVDFASPATNHAVLTTVWARRKIEDLMHQTYYQGSPEVEEEVTRIALRHRLMSQYTSFVAVDESKVGDLERAAPPPRRMPVPLPLPAGTRFEGFFGAESPEPVPMDPAGFSYRGRGIQATGFAGERKYKSRGRSPRAPSPRAGRRANRSYRRSARPHPGAMRRPSPAMALGIGGAADLAPDELRQSDAAAPPPSMDPHFTAAALQQRQGERAKMLAELLARIASLRKDGNAAEARRWAVYAAILEQTVHLPPDTDPTPSAALEELCDERVKAWTKALPALETKLALTPANTTVEATLRQIASTAGIPITLDTPALADAAALTHDDPSRIAYLDLRHATVAQALDWITRPRRLTWDVADGRIRVTSERRAGGPAAWVYDVSRIAIPLAAEVKVGKKASYQDRVKYAAALAETFRTGVAGALAVQPSDLAFLEPGYLVLFADLETHEKAGALFDALADSKGDVPEALAKLHEQTAARAEKYGDFFATQRARRRKHGRLALANQAAWRILAAAADGTRDAEADAQLFEVWNTKALQDVLKAADTALPARLAFCLDQAVRAGMDEPKLAHMATQARDACRKTTAAARKAAADNPDHVTFTVNVLYRALLFRDDADLAGALDPADRRPNTRVLRHAASCLLPRVPAKGADPLRVLLTKEASAVTGTDTVVLTALAARRAGGATWDAFRAEAQNIVGAHPLPGGAVLLVNRLARPALPVVKR